MIFNLIKNILTSTPPPLFFHKNKSKKLLKNIWNRPSDPSVDKHRLKDWRVALVLLFVGVGAMVAGGSCADGDVPNVRNISDTDAYGGDDDDDDDDTPVIRNPPKPADPVVDPNALVEEEKEIRDEVASKVCSQDKKILEYFQGLNCRVDEQDDWFEKVSGLYSEDSSCHKSVDKVITDLDGDSETRDISDGWLREKCLQYAAKAIADLKKGEANKKKWEAATKEAKTERLKAELKALIGKTDGNSTNLESYNLESILRSLLTDLNGNCAQDIQIQEIKKENLGLTKVTSDDNTNEEKKAYQTYYYTPFRKDEKHQSSQHWIPLIMKYARPTPNGESAITRVLADLAGTKPTTTTTTTLELPSKPPETSVTYPNSLVFPVRKLKIACKRACGCFDRRNKKRLSLAFIKLWWRC